METGIIVCGLNGSGKSVVFKMPCSMHRRNKTY